MCHPELENYPKCKGNKTLKLFHKILTNLTHVGFVSSKIIRLENYTNNMIKNEGFIMEFGTLKAIQEIYAKT